MWLSSLRFLVALRLGAQEVFLHSGCVFGVTHALRTNGWLTTHVFLKLRWKGSSCRKDFGLCKSGSPLPSSAKMLSHEKGQRLDTSGGSIQGRTMCPRPGQKWELVDRAAPFRP